MSLERKRKKTPFYKINWSLWGTLFSPLPFGEGVGGGGKRPHSAELRPGSSLRRLIGGLCGRPPYPLRSCVSPQPQQIPIYISRSTKAKRAVKKRSRYENALFLCLYAKAVCVKPLVLEQFALLRPLHCGFCAPLFKWGCTDICGGHLPALCGTQLYPDSLRRGRLCRRLGVRLLVL